MGFKEEGLEIDNQATFDQAQNGSLVVRNSVFFNNNPNYSDDADEDPTPPFTTRQFASRAQFENRPGETGGPIDPRLRNPFSHTAPDYRPFPDSPVEDGTLPLALPPNDGFFEPARFIGAMGASPEPDPSTPYLGNWVHRDARVVVRDSSGQTHRLDLFGSILERGGEFKLFSYVTD